MLNNERFKVKEMRSFVKPESMKMISSSLGNVNIEGVIFLKLPVTYRFVIVIYSFKFNTHTYISMCFKV